MSAVDGEATPGGAATGRFDKMRERLARLVEARPGICMEEAQRELGVAWGTVEWHLRNLEDRVASRAVRNRRLLYPAGGPARAPLHAMLRGATCARVAEDVLAHPGTGIEEVQRRVGISDRMAYHHVGRLARAGLLAKDPIHGCAALTPSPDLAALLEETRRASGRAAVVAPE